MHHENMGGQIVSFKFNQTVHLDSHYFSKEQLTTSTSHSLLIELTDVRILLVRFHRKMSADWSISKDFSFETKSEVSIFPIPKILKDIVSSVT